MTLYEKYQQDRRLVLDLLGEMADYAGFYVVGSGVMPTIAYNITISASEKERLRNEQYIEPQEPQKDSLISPAESEKKVKNAIFVIRNLINSLYTNPSEVERLSAITQLHRLLHNVIFPKIEDVQDSVEKYIPMIEAKTKVSNQMESALCFDKELGNRIVAELNLCIDLFYSPLPAEEKWLMVDKLHDFNKSVTNPQPQEMNTDKPLFNQVVIEERIKEIEDQKQRHMRNMEAMELDFRHKQSLNRTPFDEIAMREYESIITPKQGNSSAAVILNVQSENPTFDKKRAMLWSLEQASRMKEWQMDYNKMYARNSLLDQMEEIYKVFFVVNFLNTQL